MNARWHVVTALTLALAGAIPLSAIAHDFKAGSLELKHPWSAKAPSVAPVLGGYITIINHGPDADRLVGGTSAVAEKVELHQSTLVDGVARMRPASAGIDIPAGGTVSLQPGGTHLMFVNPLERPPEGKTFKATLQFEKAGPVEVEFVVQKPKPAGKHGAHATP